MKVTVWTLASDDDNGTQAAVFATEHEAYTAKFDAAFTDLDAKVTTEAKARLDAKDYDAFNDICESWLEGSLDTYSIDSHTLDVQTAPEEDGDEDYRTRARDQYGSEGAVEIDEGATVSRGADPGAYVQAWVWVADEAGDEEDETLEE